MSVLLRNYGPMLAKAIAVHTAYVLAATACGLLLGLLLGILLSRVPRWSSLLLPLLSVLQTIPGLVFIGVLFILWGSSAAVVVAALSIYAMFPVLKNTYAGILSVERRYIEAAKGCGMSPLQALVQVELPLAAPAIAAGVRMSAVYTVSWTVLAAMIGRGGLGDFVYQGVASNNQSLILLGAVPSALLAVAFGAAIDMVQRRLTPHGLRKKEAVE